MDLSSQFMDPSTLNAIADVTLSNSYSKSLVMMVNFMNVMCNDSKLNPVDFSETLGRILFPTVFDGEMWLPRSTIDDEKPFSVTFISQRQDLISNFTENARVKPNQPTRAASIIERPSRKSRLEIKATPKILSFDEQKAVKSAALKEFIPILRSITSAMALEAYLFIL